jgi:hypothetical protein
VKDLKQEGGFNWGGTHIRIWRGVVESLQTVFLEPENGFFWVGCIYGRNDDATRCGQSGMLRGGSRGCMCQRGLLTAMPMA